MSQYLIVLGLVALAGILVGGAASVWRTGSRPLAVVLGVCAALAVGGAVLRMV